MTTDSPEGMTLGSPEVMIPDNPEEMIIGNPEEMIIGRLEWMNLTTEDRTIGTKLYRHIFLLINYIITIYHTKMKWISLEMY